MERLKSFDVEVAYMDSFPNRREISMEETFKSCYIVSNHLPNRDDNQRVFTKNMFLSMPEGATFINTGRGAQVDEPGMIEALKQRPDITALLDVTNPEPVTMDSALMALPNVHITTHIAGSMGNEVRRMSNVMIDEYESWRNGDRTDNEVTPEIFEVMA
jgi:phosphoglycerate dehydrogenase-like enzyme